MSPLLRDDICQNPVRPAGTLERSAGKTCFTNSWDDFTRDRTVSRAANQAVTKLFSEIPDFWNGVVQAHRR